jgi:hypothetical protein
MMSKACVTILSCLVALALPILHSPASSADAKNVWKPDTQIGDFQFNMPSGWKRIETKDGPTLVPTNLPRGGTAYIAFLPPHQLSGDLRSWFNATWAEFHKQFTVQQAGAVESGHSPNGFDYLKIDARVSAPGLDYSEFVLGMAQVGNRAETYFWINDTGYYSYRDSLTDFENSVQFGGGNVAAPVGNAGGTGGLNGLYLGYKMRGLIGLHTHFEYLVFFPDGNAIRYLPEQGLQNFDFGNALKTSRDYCGRFQVSGDQLTIAWADNSSEKGTRTGTSLKIQGDEYFPLPRSTGLKIDGTYRREGADLANRGIRFTSNGRFTENGMLSLLAYSGSNDSPGSGTYRIANNTITLSYSDGRKIPLSFYIFSKNDEGQRPQVINVDTYRLVRDR